jgi:hypothetical protein
LQGPMAVASSTPQRIKPLPRGSDNTRMVPETQNRDQHPRLDGGDSRFGLYD